MTFADSADNLSMPAATVIPVLHYADVPAAVAWLCRAFGFSERLRIGSHRVQLQVGSGAVVVAAAPAGLEPTGQSLMVRVRDVDAHHRQARAAGAVVPDAPESYPYGERQYSTRDPGGHVWTFSQSINNIAPDAWGGELVSKPASIARNE